MMKTKNEKNWKLSSFLLLLIVVIVDRSAWAYLSNWREDQATNLWLGYTNNIFHIPVGIISSTLIPNPNGMPIIAMLLSLLPNLWSISMFLGILQAALIIWVSFELSHMGYSFYFVCIPLLASITLRSISNEFWGQYIMVDVNLAFIGIIFHYLNRPRLKNLIPVAMLCMVAPSLYLAGLLNSIIFLLVTLAVLYLRSAKAELKDLIITGMAVFLIVGVSIAVTWIPYFQSVDIHSLSTFASQISPIQKLEQGFGSLLALPIWGILQWSIPSIIPTPYNNFSVLSLSAKSLYVLSCILFGFFMVLVVIRVFAKLIEIISKSRIPNLKTENIQNNDLVVLLMILFLLLSCFISPLIGGPAWALFERSDQAIQYLPILFILALLIQSRDYLSTPKMRMMTYSVFICFVFANAISGALIADDYFDNGGKTRTTADVPLLYKHQAMEFIATDWRAISNDPNIPVAYDLGGGYWDFVTDFGKNLNPWYQAPMTIGRSFDYELLRIYGLTNQQEGIQERNIEPGRYLITYASSSEKKFPGFNESNYYFGGLRVIVFEKYKTQQ